MIINSHCHIFQYPDHWSKEMADIYMGALSEIPLWWNPEEKWKPENLHVDVGELITDMDKGKVDKAFVMGHVWKPYNCETPLDWIANIVQKHPDRFIGFHVADPIGGLIEVEKLDRAVNEFGFGGLKLFPAYNHVALNDRRMYPLFEKAQQMDIPVLMHTGWTHVPLAKMEWQRPVLIEDVAIAFPKLRIIMGHTGFQWALEALMVMKKHKNVHGDFAFWHDLPFNFIVQVFTFAKKMELMDRLLWGTDYPHYSHKSDMGIYRKLMEYTKKHEVDAVITEEDLSLFFGENARRVARIEN